jgi:hypothetical protein
MSGRTLGANVLATAILVAASLGATPSAFAVPSFARQTGMACEACHTVFPELTHFGRVFKASGYTLSNLKQVRDVSPKKGSCWSCPSSRRCPPWRSSPTRR